MEEHLQDNLAKPMLFCIFIMALFILFPKSLGDTVDSSLRNNKLMLKDPQELLGRELRPQTSSCYSANRQHLKPNEIIRVLTEDVIETKRMKRLHKGLDTFVVDWYTDSY